MRRLVHKTQYRQRPAPAGHGRWVARCTCSWTHEAISEQHALRVAAEHRKSMDDAAQRRAEREEQSWDNSWI